MGGYGTDDKTPSLYWNYGQAHDFNHILRVTSNLNIERAAEKIIISNLAYAVLSQINSSHHLRLQTLSLLIGAIVLIGMKYEL